MSNDLDNFASETKAPEVKTETVVETKVEAPIVEAAKVEPVVEVKAEPVVEVKAEPVVEPKVEPVPTIDTTKIFSEASNGKITSKEQLEQLIKENNEYKERIEKTPELDDYTLKLDSWMKKGYDPELFHKINNLPLDEMSGEDKMKVSLAIQNPEWTKEDIDLYVKDTYGLMSEDEEGYNATKVKVGKLKLTQDARQHEESLRKLQEMTVYSSVDEKEAIHFESERQSTWKQNLPNIVNGINTIPFTIDDKGTTFNYVPTPLQRQAVVNAVQNAILNAPVGYDEQGIKAVTDLIHQQFINQNINEISKAIANTVRSSQVEKTIKEVHNPSGMQPTPVVATKVEKSRDDVLFDTMMGVLR